MMKTGTTVMDQLYGLEVCRAKNGSRFSLLSEEIRKNLMGVKQNVLDSKQSKYNSKVFVHLCEVCGARGRCSSYKVSVRRRMLIK